MFFARLFQDLLPDAVSLHEPDIFNFNLKRGKGFSYALKQVRESGLRNFAFGRWNLIHLSDARLREELSHTDAVRMVHQRRRFFIDSRPGSVYVESSSGYYGLIDVLPDVFTQHRLAYIVRNGHDWVQSWMNWGALYNKGRIRRLLAHNWPRASEIRDDPCRSRWESMSRFEKICWCWAKLNGYALRVIQKNPHARIFRFEELFRSEDRYHHLKACVGFLTALCERPAPPARELKGWLERPLNRSEGAFPSWHHWTREQKAQFNHLCGPLMGELGYPLNP